MRLGKLLAVLLLLNVVGCDQATMMKTVLQPQDELVAKDYIDQLRQRQFEKIERDMDPSMRNASLHEMLVRMADLFPSQPAESVKVVGVQKSESAGESEINITFELQFPAGWRLANVATRTKAGQTTIVGFHVDSLPHSLEDTNRFNLSGKSLLHYLALVLTVLIPLFVLAVLVVCVRTKIERRKWLWILAIILGVGSFSLNWTTGTWHFTLLYVSLFGAAATAAPYGPWMLSISIPLGAIVFLLRRKGIGAAPVAARHPRTPQA